MSNLPWLMDLTFQVPMQYCPLQNLILLSSPETFTTEHRFCFVPATSFFLGLLIVVLRSSPIAIWTFFTQGGSSFGVISFFVLLYSSWVSRGKYTGVVCHSLFQWITFCQNSLLWSDHLGWSYTAWFIASLSYTSPLTMTRQWSMKGLRVCVCVCIISLILANLKCINYAKLILLSNV